jgi:hypothetical protein
MRAFATAGRYALLMFSALIVVACDLTKCTSGDEAGPPQKGDPPPPLSTSADNAFGGDPVRITIRVAEPVPTGTVARFTVSTEDAASPLTLPREVTMAEGETAVVVEVASARVLDFVSARYVVTWTNYPTGTLSVRSSVPVMPEPTSVQVSFDPVVSLRVV